MELRQLKIFLAVASKLNITRAAENLHLSQSSVSEQIQNLEEDLHVKLFDRSPRQLKLTAAGERLLDYAQPLLSLAEEARSIVHIASELALGTLMVGAPETICATRLPPILAGFTLTHPAVALKVNVASTGELLQQISQEILDVCFVFGVRQTKQNLQSEIVCYEELVVLVPPDNPLCLLNDVTLENLVNEVFLVTQMGCVYREMFENTFPDDQPGRPRIAGEIDSIATIMRMVEMGIGCALLPRLVVDPNDARYVAVTVDGFTGARDVPISMVWKRQPVQPPRLELFLESARQGFLAVTPIDDHHLRVTKCQ